MWAEPTSASSPGLEDSTSPSKRTATDASDRSSGTPTPPESSSDGGPTFRDGATSPGSEPLLLPTPSADESDPTEEFVAEMDGRFDPQHRMYLPGRKWHGQRTLRRTTALLAATSSSEASPASPSAPLDAEGPAPTNGGSGPSSPVWLASYDPDSSSSRTSEVSYRLVTWRRPQASLFGDLPSERFSETWPTSGSMRSGRAFALPTSERPTDGSASSSLPTPNAADGTGGKQHAIGSISRTGQREDGTKVQVSLRDALNLLPTPRHEGFDAGNHRGQPDGLPQTVKGLLPTPRTTDANGRGPGNQQGGPQLRDFIGDRTDQQSNDGSES